MIKAYYRWIKNNMMKGILNYYYSVYNGTLLYDEAIISNHKIIGCPSLFRATTSLRINTAKKR